MPEFPDILADMEALEPRVIGKPLAKVRVATPFLLRTVIRRYADNETNYCTRCQMGRKVLAGVDCRGCCGSDWPRSLEELER
jgi:hypothetical protein